MAYIWLILGFTLLFYSGNWLVKGSTQLSAHFKISSLVIGLTVVAFGTSAPELFVSVKAAFSGVPDIAIGNIVGSNIANIGLVLGLVAMVMPIVINSKGIWFDWVIMIIATLMLILFSTNGVIGFWEGFAFLTALMLYLSWSVWQSRRKSRKEALTYPTPEIKLPTSIIIVLGSFVGLYFGAEWLVKGATELARTWGVSDRVIGISIVAFGTSVPELATSLAAIAKKENDISVGNIIGSNIFNIWAVLGATAVVKPLGIANITMLRIDLLWTILLSVMLLIFMIPLKNGIINRWKGVLLFLVYIYYIYILF
ncbi:calcium/sodium antiporter [Alkalitalea saponilacus]|uniref:Cation:H+ antiporter n=1 Tax=Alkalitalea saponilacus TaxID=889453 RepID=A0A1T5BKY8_9BACT|nr:calcium/sodium antiporter [Alkalitalea saponilacus]ASB49661.1 sodium:calcium antiporter [Alkalitalea saponilacus]SKB47767.1 cation:H+ antiporter [Alkalitalea saponilacus]